RVQRRRREPPLRSGRAGAGLPDAPPMRPRSVTIRLGLLAAAGCAIGCAGSQSQPPRSSASAPAAGPLVPPTPAEIPPADSIPGTFAVRQKLTAKSAHGGGSFEAVLQKRPGKL